MKLAHFRHIFSHFPLHFLQNGGPAKKMAEKLVFVNLVFLHIGANHIKRSDNFLKFIDTIREDIRRKRHCPKRGGGGFTHARICWSFFHQVIVSKIANSGNAK